MGVRIEQDPGNAGPHLRPGELLGHHCETEAALPDFDRAEALDPALTADALARGELLFRAGRFAEAKAAPDRFLAAQPQPRRRTLDPGAS